MLLSQAWETYESDKRIEGFSPQTLKPSSLAHRVRSMKSLLRWSYEKGHISINPAAKIKEPKVGERIPKFLTEREIEHLREACYTPLEKVLFEFMFSTGM